MTDEQKITRVLACCGKAPRSAWALDDAERAAVAALCGDDGLLVAGGQESFRLLMVEHYERRKATSEEFDKVEVRGRLIATEITAVGLTYDEAIESESNEPPQNDE